MHRLKVGLLGAGYIAPLHARALSVLKDVELRAVCDVSESRAAQVAAAFGIPTVFSALSQLLESDCDIVHVLLPPYLHEEAARQLLNAGKSVLLEKPMGLTSSGCQSLVDLAKEKGLRLGVSHNFLFLPGYEKLRHDVANGAIGAPDHLTVNWLFELGLIQAGPYDNWMLGSEGNLLFELGSHISAFAIDLLGSLDGVTAVASHPIELPGQQRVFRHWNAIGHRGSTSVAMNLSAAPGQSQRSLHLRGVAATATFDFERDLYWCERVHSSNAVLDALHTTQVTALQIGMQGWKNFCRYVAATFQRRPHDNAYQDSLSRSIATFYRTFHTTPDPRLEGQFGVEVIRLCERIVQTAGVESAAPPQEIRTADVPPPNRPTVLVVGGTGFIGRRLVKRLAERGVGVRVLSRSLTTARLALSGVPVELMLGSHGDGAVLVRALEGIEVVYHLAKATGKRWEDYLAGDIEPTRVLAQAALAQGVRRFIYTGTIDSYSSAREGDVVDADTPLDTRIESRNFYARSKAACEMFLQTMQRERGLPLVIFRPGIVIGGDNPPAHWGVGMFHSGTRVQLWGQGATKLPFVLVDDVAEGLVLGMTVPGIDGQQFLLVDEPLLTAKEYVHEVARAGATRISASATPIWRFFVLDVLKEAVKHLVRHRNRRVPSFHDWACRAHCCRYLNDTTRQALGWQPSGTRDGLVSEGIDAPVRRYYQ